MSYVRENDFFIVQMNRFGLHILIIMVYKFVYITL